MQAQFYLIQKQDWRIFQYCASYGDTLFLTARKHRLTDDSVVTLRQLGDERVTVSLFASGDNFFLGCLEWCAHEQVLADSHIE